MPSIKKNYIYNTFYELLKIILPLITTPYISRVLGAEGIGTYSFTFSVITYFMLFGSLGTATYGTREISRSRNDKGQLSRLFWEIELMTVISSCVAMAAWGLVTFLSERYKWYFLALSPFLLGTAFDISWLYIGLERVPKLVKINSIVKVLSVILLFVLVRNKEDIVRYCIINSCSLLFGNLSCWFFLPQLVDNADFKTFHLGHHFRESFIYFVPTIATSLYTVLDKTLIGLITNSSYQNGYYEQATKIISIVKSFSFVSLNAVMTARISFLFAEKKFDEIKARINESMDYILLICVGAVFGIIGISSRFVPLFFGDGYEEVIELLWYMVLLIVIIGISNCLGGQFYTPSGKRMQSARYLIWGSMVNVLFNLVLIPGFGAKGAVFSSIIAESIITIMYIKNCEGYFEFINLASMLWRRIIAGTIMSLVVFWIGNIIKSAFSVGVQLICGVLVYVLVLLLLRDVMMYKICKFIISRLRKDHICG